MNNILVELINNIPHAVFWKNKEHIIEGCNQEFSKQLGYNNPQEIIGKSDYDLLFDPDSIRKYHQDENDIFRTGIPKLNYEETQHQSNGQVKTLLVSKVPVYDDQKKIVSVLGIYTDITDRKKNEIKLKKAKEQAEEANLAKSAFIANMSHDIRTPLTGVIGLADLVEKKTENIEVKNYAHDIHECGEQLLNMLNNILCTLSTESITEKKVIHQVFSIHDLIQEVVEIEKPTIELKNLRLIIDVDPQIPSNLISDVTKVHRILLNLIGNAVKFTHQGSITLSVKLTALSNKNATLLFSVSDTGIGIPKNQQHRVYDRFFRVNPSYKGQYEGNGVGLHLAQSYAKILKSKIRLMSQEGIGTTFFFEIVCKIPPQPSKKILSKKHRVQHDDVQIGKLLLIEDNPIALTIIEKMLENLGIHFVSATDGETALTVAKQTPFSLIITDIGLPGISGIEFAKKIRVWHKEYQTNCPPIIALTAHEYTTLHPEHNEAIFDKILHKPLTKEILIRVLKQLTNHFYSSDGQVFNEQ